MKKQLLIIFGILVGFNLNAQQNISLSLDEAINFALENSYAMINANRDIEMSIYKNKETVAMGLPQINASIDYQDWLIQQVSLIPAEFVGGDPGDFVEIAFGTENNLSGTVTLNQLLFDGAYTVGLKYLKSYMQISQNTKEKTEQIIRETVINAYGNVLFTEEGITIIEKNVATVEENLKQTTEIYLNGFAEEESVEQLKITLASLKITLSKTKKLKEISYKMLNIILGIDINDKVILTDNLDSLTTENIKLDLLSSDFNVENHIDFKIAELQQTGKEALLKIEKSRYLPTLTGFINFGYIGYSDSFTFHKKNQNWFSSSLLGISLNVPIFSSFERSSRKQQARIDYEKSTTNLSETSQKVYLELDKAKIEYEFSIEEFETSKQNLALAERIAKKQEIKFFEGISTSFDLTNAQRQLYSMQQNYLEAMLHVIASKASLDKALNLPINN
jgi:outer membrane protein TolC